MVETKKKYINEKCLSLIGVSHDFKVEWNADRYLIMDKMFVMVGGDKGNRPIVSVKLDPAKGEHLRNLYKDVVVPGYYMNKTHWNSIYLDVDFSEDMLFELINDSYNLIFSKFSKKKQNEILGGIK